jgi:hypothetical protein
MSDDTSPGWRPYSPCARDDACIRCNVAHAGECGATWEQLGRTTKAVIYDGECGPVKIYIHRAYAGGNLRWVNVTVAKEGSSLGGWARVMMAQLSAAADTGNTALVDAQLRAMLGQRFVPWGRTSLDDIPECTSIPDLVAQLILKEIT